ncbi:unnamed protein product, partial [Sphacelaria rigidula]
FQTLPICLLLGSRTLPVIINVGPGVCARQYWRDVCVADLFSRGRSIIIMLIEVRYKLFQYRDSALRATLLTTSPSSEYTPYSAGVHPQYLRTSQLTFHHEQHPSA